MQLKLFIEEGIDPSGKNIFFIDPKENKLKEEFYKNVENGKTDKKELPKKNKNNR